MGTEDYASWNYKVPIIHPQGHYEVDGLPPGAYQIRTYAFDTEAYALSFDTRPFYIAKDQHDPAHIDLELEAKELRYGRAVYADGTR
jgi:hypothetical protein